MLVFIFRSVPPIIGFSAISNVARLRKTTAIDGDRRAFSMASSRRPTRAYLCVGSPTSEQRRRRPFRCGRPMCLGCGREKHLCHCERVCQAMQSSFSARTPLSQCTASCPSAVCSATRLSSLLGGQHRPSNTCPLSRSTSVEAGTQRPHCRASVVQCGLMSVTCPCGSTSPFGIYLTVTIRSRMVILTRKSCIQHGLASPFSSAADDAVGWSRFVRQERPSPGAIGPLDHSVMRKVHDVVPLKVLEVACQIRFPLLPLLPSSPGPPSPPGTAADMLFFLQLHKTSRTSATS